MVKSYKIKIAVMMLSLLIMLTTSLGFTCGVQFYDYSAIWYCDEPKIEFATDASVIYNETLELDGIVYSILVAYPYAGSDLSIFENKIGSVYDDALLWECETELKGEELHLKIIEDRVSDYEGKTIILKQRPIDNSNNEKLFFAYGALWYSEDSKMEFMTGLNISYDNTLLVDGVNYNIYVSYKNDGSGADIYNADADKFTNDSKLWETATKVVNGELHMTIIKDNVSQSNGQTIVFKRRPKTFTDNLFYMVSSTWYCEYPAVAIRNYTNDIKLNNITLNNKKYNFYIKYNNEGTIAHFYDNRFFSENVIIWETETEVRNGKLYMTVTKDHIANYTGRTLVLTQDYY